MDRLTDALSTKCSMSPWDWCGLDNECKRDCFKPEPCKIPKMLRRLAEYEDTGLMPEEIKTIQAEKEVYKKHWLDLCDKILAEIDKDGWCRLSVTKEEAVKMKRLFEGMEESE